MKVPNNKEKVMVEAAGIEPDYSLDNSKSTYWKDTKGKRNTASFML
jgi:hypothetical protein